MFPLSVRGSIRIDNPMKDTPGAVAQRIAFMIDAAARTSLETDGSQVRFHKTGFGLLNGRGNVLTYFDAGEFRVEPQDTSLRVFYALSTIHMFLIATGALAAMAALAVFGARGRTMGDFRVIGEMFVFLWLWVFGVRYVTAAIRAPLWLRRGLARSG